MAAIASNLSELVGNTPLLEPARFVCATGCEIKARVLCKLETANPTFSSKDRAAVSIIQGAVESGELEAGGTVVEATSGNMGIALASAAAALGMKMVVFMPASMSEERKKMLVHLGAELHLVQGSMDEAVAQAKRYVEMHDEAYLANQFGNPLNAAAHYKSTGPEIWRDTDGKVDAFVAGVGSSGTLVGTGRYLREQNPDVLIVGVEPAESPLLSEGWAAPHGIQGIGANFVPGIFDRDVVCEIVPVETQRAIARARLFSKTEGCLVGISSGAALDAALKIAERADMEGKTVVALLPDTAERYVSTVLFDEEQ